MAKITIETDDINEARSLLDALETRDAPATTTPVGVPLIQTHAPDEPGAREVDANGMEWSEDLHSGNKATNADGSWKARKGMAQQAKDALAAHKAGGGNITPPADTGMPTADVTGGMPNAGATGGMPTADVTGARAEDMPPPITQAKLEEKILGMIGRGTLQQDATAAIGAAPANTYQGLLDRHQISRADPSSVLTTNETLRAQVYASCCEIEPEAPGAA